MLFSLLVDPDRPFAEEQSRPEEAMLYCPRCNSRLVSHKCKLVCETCGYYMSCADYY